MLTLGPLGPQFGKAIIAEIFKETGIADPIEPDEFEKPSSGADAMPS